MSDKASTAKTDKKVERPKGPQESKSERPKGPLDAFRDLVGQWERGVNELANKQMRAITDTAPLRATARTRKPVGSAVGRTAAVAPREPP